MRNPGAFFLAFAQCLILPLLLVSCDLGGGSKDDFTANSDPSSGSVYTAGYYIDSMGKYLPLYWRGAQRYELTIPSGGYMEGWASSTQVVDGTVYVSGAVYYYAASPEGSSRDMADYVKSACYWKGRTPTLLPVPSGTTSSSASSIYVSGSDIYISGEYLVGEEVSVPCYWKNGAGPIVLPLSSAGNEGEASSIFVSSGKVYVAGRDITVGPGSSTKPCYWIDGVYYSLTSPGGAVHTSASMIAVSEGSVYVGGDYSTSHVIETEDGGIQTTYTYQPCYWIDGARTDLSLPISNGYSSYGFAVQDRIVYTAGSYGSPVRPCYWEGTVRTDIPIPMAESEASAAGIFVTGKTVYTAGNYSATSATAHACYWTGTARTELPVPAGCTESIAVAIYVE